MAKIMKGCSMLSVSEIKKLIRSRSLSFVRNSRPGEYSDELKDYEWEGHKIFYRAGMADGGILYNVLLHPTVMLRPSKILFRKRVQERDARSPRPRASSATGCGRASRYSSSSARSARPSLRRTRLPPRGWSTRTTGPSTAR